MITLDYLGLISLWSTSLGTVGTSRRQGRVREPKVASRLMPFHLVFADMALAGRPPEACASYVHALQVSEPMIRPAAGGAVMAATLI